MAEQLRVFVSHSHEDNAFCHAIVQALRDAGADVWYDEHNMGSGRLGPTIEREIRDRHVFVVILSPDALGSRWVEDETRWAYGLLRKDDTRLIQPIIAAPIVEDDIWLFLQDFKRIEAHGCKPLPMVEATRRLLYVLSLTPRGTAPVSTIQQPTDDIDDLVNRAKAFAAQKKYAEARSLFERATQFAPNSVSAWNNKGVAYFRLRHYADALAAFDQALTLDPTFAQAWSNKGAALSNMQRYDEALIALNQALALDSNETDTWIRQGVAFSNLRRFEEALSAYNQALTRDASNAGVWSSKGVVLTQIGRDQEALAAYEHALALNPVAGYIWKNEAIVLRKLGRTAEAERAEQSARDLGWTL